MIQIVRKKSVNILDIFLIISTCAESMFNFQTVYKLILQLLCSQAKLLKDCVAIATSFSLSMFLLLYMTVKNGEKEKKKSKVSSCLYKLSFVCCLHREIKKRLPDFI